MPIFNFGGIKNLEEVMSDAIYLLEKFAAGSSFESQIIS
jgi:hypothetical protein